MPIDPSILYNQLMMTKRQPHEPLRNFNYRFQKASSKLMDPYKVDEACAFWMYLTSLDSMIKVFLKRDSIVTILPITYLAALKIK